MIVPAHQEHRCMHEHASGDEDHPEDESPKAAAVGKRAAADLERGSPYRLQRSCGTEALPMRMSEIPTASLPDVLSTSGVEILPMSAPLLAKHLSGTVSVRHSPRGALRKLFPRPLRGPDEH